MSEGLANVSGAFRGNLRDTLATQARACPMEEFF
jgi:hypothetical protein